MVNGECALSASALVLRSACASSATLRASDWGRRKLDGWR